MHMYASKRNIRVTLFQCLAGKGNLKEAIQYLRKALKLEPESKVCSSNKNYLFCIA